MSESRLLDLLLRWEQAQEKGEKLSPEALCPDEPELAAELRRRIDWLRTIDGRRSVSVESTIDRALPPPPGRTPTRRVLSQVEVPGYEILGELGRGGMGVVYKARQVGLGRLVALKMILRSELAGSEARRLFQAEAEAVARLQHPNIVQIYEIGERNDHPFFSLEYCPGGSLTEKLDGKPVAAREAATLVRTLAQAVHAAHLKGIVHRDLKPGNVLIAENDTVKVTDFGLAKELGATSRQTHSGAILGTPSYMSPEQAAGRTREVGPLSDVYALGAILYECLTGRPPFNAATALETLVQVQADEPVPPRRLRPSVARDLETICLKCLEKQSHRRYASADALADDLGRFLNGEPIVARRVRFWERAVKWARRRPTAAALAGVLMAVGLAATVTGFLFYAQLAQQREAENRRRAEVRAEVLDLKARGQMAANSQGWTQAEDLLNQALEKIASEPALAPLRPDVESVLGQVKARLTALDAYHRFIQDRDEALFQATLAGGENAQTIRKTARERAHAALAVVGLSPEGRGALATGLALTRKEKEDVRSSSYALLLMLAEIEARPLPGQKAKEHREHLNQALDLLDRADALKVVSRAIHLRRARYLTLLGKVAEAAKESLEVQATAAKTDRDPQDHYLVGHELYSQGNLKLANQEFRRALSLDARHFWTHYFLGVCCMTSGKAEAAVAHLSICQSQRPKLIWIYLLRGFAWGQMEDYAAAEADFDRAVALQPSPATLYVLYNNRGVMRISQKDARTKGMEDLTKAAALRPDLHQAQASLAEALRLEGRLDEAARRLDEAVAAAGRQVKAGELRPATLALLHQSRARLHLQRGNRDEAVRDLEEAVRLLGDNGPLRARAEADRGRVLHLQNRLAQALAAYDAALKADSGRVDVHRWRGQVLLSQHRYGEAAAAFDAYLEKGGAPAMAVFQQRGLARAQVGRHTEAVEDYSRALDAKPPVKERPRLYLYRGQEHLAVNSLRAALSDFQEARRLDPESADASLSCAHVLVKLGELQQGVAEADNAVRGAPKEPRLWHGAARVYAYAASQVEPGAKKARIRARYQEQAVRLLRRALDRVPAGERRAYWRENVTKDAALSSLRGAAELAAGFGGLDR